VTFGLANEGKLLQAAGFIPVLFVAAVSGASYKIRGSRDIQCLDSVTKGQSSKISFLRSHQFKPFCSAFISCRQEQRGWWLYICLPWAEVLVSLFKKKKTFGQLLNENKFFLLASIFDYILSIQQRSTNQHTQLIQNWYMKSFASYLFIHFSQGSTATTDLYLAPEARI